MSYFADSEPLHETSLTGPAMENWTKKTAAGGAGGEVYSRPSEQQLRELENVRSLSRELQDHLSELENSVRIADVDSQAMNPTAPILDFSEDHEFTSANKLEDYYSQEDKNDAIEEEKQRLTKGKAPKTEIQQFFTDQSVFLTGGTGFLGKVIIEKLIRSCGDIDTIYVLIRKKQGKDAITRLHEMLDDFLFNKAHEINPKGLYKVVPIVGDMMLPGLGISEEQRKLLCSKVTIIINAAATVKFDEKLAAATGINVKGTIEVLKLAKECRFLKAITHVSTAFANCNHKFIEEKFYDPPLTAESLEAVSSLNEDLLDSITPKLLDEYPNTYCFTKAVAENAIKMYGEGLPICILRPSIVISTYEEPVRGWTDSFYGPTGLMIGVGTGVVRAMYIDTEKVADMVPVDLTVNAILATTWFTAKNYKENQTSDIPIYNFVSGAQNPLTWDKFISLNKKNGIDKPTTKAVWYYGLNTTNNYFMFTFYNFFLHYLPALFIDVYCKIVGKPQVMLKFYNKITKLAGILIYFATQEWRFSDDGVRNMWKSLSDQDKIVFPFSLADMSWDYLIETFLLGLRVYLVKDDINTLPEARKKWNRLYYMHQTLKVLLGGLIAYCGYLFVTYIVNILFG